MSRQEKRLREAIAHFQKNLARELGYSKDLQDAKAIDHYTMWLKRTKSRLAKLVGE